jgi:trans-aconitate 2-methyltransferase
MPTWDASQYLRFERERTQPCVDLLWRVERIDVKYAVDLGCGPGNSTKALAERFPGATIMGVDNSPAMIERARRDHPRFGFVESDVAKWESDRPCDLILSNAVFQWVPHHEQLLPRLMQQLRDGGVLAVQMPRNFQSPVHQILRELATSPQWSPRVGGREPYWVHPPQFHYDVLAPVCSKVELWETEYIHILPDHEAIIEWYKGTGMRPYLEPLTQDEQLDFIDQVRSRLLIAYPKSRDGRVLFPFLRIFLIAVR